MTGKTIICMLRNDLRLHDNEALLWAFKNGSQVLPIYCFDPRHYSGTYHFGFPKTGPHRLKFLLECIQDLRQILKSRGSGLIVRTGKPEEVITDLIQKIGKESIDSLVYSEEITKEELDVESSLKSSCGVKVKTFWENTLYHRDDLPFHYKQLPDIYTQFRKVVESNVPVRSVISTPRELKPLPSGIEEGNIPTSEDLGVSSVHADSRTAFPYKGGESTGLERIDYYLWQTDKVAHYKETRNCMIGSDYSTKFSPWLAHGCLSPRFIYSEIKRYEKERTANQSTYWVLFELLWRDYFRYVALKYGDKIFYPGGIQGKHIPWKTDKNAFNAWKESKTGVPYVDANMRELAATGFMSNRGRQNVASFLTKDLKLDWRLGAEWFESMLIDHDVCSNYGNWLYSAGIGNDPREDRKFNMVKQGLDYDPNGDFIRLWIPELNKVKGADVHTVWALSSAVLSRAEVVLAETYPKPLLIAPEWAKHMGKIGSGGGCGRGGGGSKLKQQKGMDFYFKNSQPRQ
ncbi:cryptochrome DASH [Patella vulgata]|uniref:cryptochrome DASH n=1 Tax=Patella vulgata TaxID=6465 RepID=UPI00217FDC5D|nr:cryptochrome DASH [Patella vulgata]